MLIVKRPCLFVVLEQDNDREACQTYANLYAQLQFANEKKIFQTPTGNPAFLYL